MIYIACHLIASGTELIASRMLDARRIYVVGLPLLAGVGLIALPDLFGPVPGWAEAVVASPLAAATILALVLNLVLNAGVSSRATSRIEIDGALSDIIIRFFERQGASWGARQDVISRAAPAVTEWCEELVETVGPTFVNLELTYDEARLLATVRLPLDYAAEPHSQFAKEVSALESAAGTLSRRYDCRVRLLPDGELVLVFEA